MLGEKQVLDHLKSLPPGSEPFTCTDLAVANRLRAHLWNGTNPNGSPVSKGMMFCAVELGGEVGEILNVVKKMELERLGMIGSRATLDDLKDEVGDGIVCLFLLAAEAGFDPMQAAAAKFNKTSRKLGFPIEMEPPNAVP